MWNGFCAWPYAVQSTSADSGPAETTDALMLLESCARTRLRYYFCPGCRTRMYWTPNADAGKVYVFTTLLPNDFVAEAGFEWAVSVFVGDTGDGALSSCLRGADGTLAPRFVGFSHTGDAAVWRPHASSGEGDAAVEQQRDVGDGKLRCCCACGHVQFKIDAMRGLAEGGKVAVEAKTERYITKWIAAEVGLFVLGDGRTISTDMDLDGHDDVLSGRIHQTRLPDGRMAVNCKECNSSIMMVSNNAEDPREMWIALGCLQGRLSRLESLLDWSKVEHLQVPDRAIKFPGGGFF